MSLEFSSFIRTTKNERHISLMSPNLACVFLFVVILTQRLFLSTEHINKSTPTLPDSRNSKALECAEIRESKEIMMARILAESGINKQWLVVKKKLENKWTKTQKILKIVQNGSEKRNLHQTPPKICSYLWWVMISNFKVKSTTRRFYCWIILNLCILSKCKYSTHGNFHVKLCHFSFLFDWIFLLLSSCMYVCG